MSLTRRQISAICSKNNITYRYSKVPPKECGVDLRIPRDPRYSRANQLEILHKGLWHPLGWLWNLEKSSEDDIVAMIHNIIKTKYIGPYSSQCSQCHNELNIGLQVTSDIEIAFCQHCNLKVKQSKIEGIIEITTIPVYTIATATCNTQHWQTTNTMDNHAH